MGAAFDQIECNYTDPDGNKLLLQKRGTDIDTSMLAMDSKAYRKSTEAAASQAKTKARGDI